MGQLTNGDRQWKWSDPYDLVPIFLTLFVYLRAVDPRKVLLGWDIDGGLLQPVRALHRALASLALHSGLGTDNATSIAAAPLYALGALLQRIGFSMQDAEWILFGLVFIMLPVSVIAYFRVALPEYRIAKMVAATAVAFNFYVAIVWYTPQIPFIVGLYGGPLLAAAILLTTRRFSALSLAFLVLASIFVSAAGGNAAVALMMIATTMVLLFIGSYGRRTSLLRMLTALSVVVGINFFWIAPTARFFVSHGQDVLLGDYVRSWGVDTLRLTSEAANMFNVPRLIGTWDWTHSDGLGHRYIIFAPWYETNFFIWLLSFIVPILALFSLRRIKDPRVITLWCVATVSMVAMRGSYGVTGKAFYWLFSHISAFEAFRDPFTKFGIPSALFLSLLAGLGTESLSGMARQKWRLAIAPVALLLIAAAILPWWAGQMFRNNAFMPTYYVELPKAYTDAAAFINRSNRGFSRVLVLPLSPQLSYTALAWGFNGPDPLPFFIDRPTIVEARSWADPFADIAFGDVASGPRDLRNAVRRFHIKYVIVHRDIEPSFYGAKNGPQTEALVRSAGGKLAASFGSEMLAVYEFEAPEGIASVNAAVPAKNVDPRDVAKLSPLEAYEAAPNSTLPGSIGRGSQATPPRAIQPFPSSARVFAGSSDWELQTRTGVAISQIPVASSKLLVVDGIVFRSGDVADVQPGLHDVYSANDAGIAAKSWRKTTSADMARWAAAYDMPVPKGVHALDVTVDVPLQPPGTIVRIGVTSMQNGIETVSGLTDVTLTAGMQRVAFDAGPSRNVYRLFMYGPASSTVVQSRPRAEILTVAGRAQVEFPRFIDRANTCAALSAASCITVASKLDALAVPELPAGVGALYRHDAATRSGDARFRAPGAGLLTLNTTYNTDWVASSHGRDLERYLVDGVFPGWRVNANEDVRLVYRGAAVRIWSSYISLGVLFVSLVAIVVLAVRVVTMREWKPECESALTLD